ncbi:MAG: hypothetical protein ACYTHJ_12510 [Planctomycetota bacterium]|jgi:hypothetical protein
MWQGILGRSTEYALLAKDLRKIRKNTDNIVCQNARHHLAARMGRRKGLPQKFGQIMSMSDHNGKAQAFEPLTNQSKALPVETVIPILEE